MRYIIIGAGAIGGSIGARLALGGHEVVLTARGAHLAAMRERGLTFATPGGSQTVAVTAVAGAGDVALRADDVLVMAAKTQDVTGVLDDWAWRPVAGETAAGETAAGGTAAGGPLAGGGVAADRLPVFCAQNGVTSERLALRRFRRVYGVCVWMPATHLEPGVVEAQGTPKHGLLALGRYPGGADDTAAAVAADLTACDFVAPVREDVMRWKYGKLLTNLGNAVQAVYGTELPDGADAESVRSLRRRAQEEGRAALTAAGIAWASPEEQAGLRGDQVRIEPVNGSRRAGGSTWQSLTRGTGSIEADYLNGEIALLGRLHGVPTPVNERLQRLANQFAEQRRSPGTLTDAEKSELIGA